MYFQVNVKGVLFQLGDLHATMGEGEISGQVTVKLNLIKGAKLSVH